MMTCCTFDSSVKKSIYSEQQVFSHTIAHLSNLFFAILILFTFSELPSVRSDLNSQRYTSRGNLLDYMSLGN
jgi:hypothetical protein